MIFLCLPIGDADDYYNMLPVRHESGSFPDHLLAAQPLPFCWELLQTRQPHHQDVPEHFQPLDSSILTKGVYNTFKAVIEYLRHSQLKNWQNLICNEFEWFQRQS